MTATDTRSDLHRFYDWWQAHRDEQDSIGAGAARGWRAYRGKPCTHEDLGHHWHDEQGRGPYCGSCGDLVAQPEPVGRHRKPEPEPFSQGWFWRQSQMAQMTIAGSSALLVILTLALLWTLLPGAHTQ